MTRGFAFLSKASDKIDSWTQEKSPDRKKEKRTKY